MKGRREGTDRIKKKLSSGQKRGGGRTRAKEEEREHREDAAGFTKARKKWREDVDKDGTRGTESVKGEGEVVMKKETRRSRKRNE